MSEFNIEVEGGKSVRLPTAGKYCPKDIIVSAIGGGGGGEADTHYDTFWDAYQENGDRRNYNYLFAYNGWDDVSFNPKYDIECSEDNGGTNIFYSSTRITRIPVDIIVNNTSAGQMFYRATNLETIKRLVLNGATSFSGMFTACSKLKNLTVEGTIGISFNISASSVLTNDSVQSIIDCLADLTGKATQTFTVHQTVRNAMTADQVDTIVNKKNWTLAPAAATN